MLVTVNEQFKCVSQYLGTYGHLAAVLRGPPEERRVFPHPVAVPPVPLVPTLLTQPTNHPVYVCVCTCVIRGC